MSQRPWTDEEYGFLEENRHQTAAWIAAELGRTTSSVQNKRAKLGSGWIPVILEKGEEWSAEEERFLIDHPRLSTEDQAKALGRSVKAVNARRAKLRARGVTLDTIRNTSPFLMGNRPLVAKTCRKCGLLLQAGWFNLKTKTGSWTSVCGRCRDRSKEHQRNDDRTKEMRKASVARFQAMTTPAERSGLDWTGEDDLVLADPDLTILQKAFRLKRSYKSVIIACSRRGYRSKIGLGDPERDQWKINNPNVAA